MTGSVNAPVEFRLSERMRLQTYFVDFRELDPLLRSAAPADGGYVEHPVPELDESSSVGPKNADSYLIKPKT